MLIRRANRPGDITLLRDCTSIIYYIKKKYTREREKDREKTEKCVEKKKDNEVIRPERTVL